MVQYLAPLRYSTWWRGGAKQISQHVNVLTPEALWAIMDLHFMQRLASWMCSVQQKMAIAFGTGILASSCVPVNADNDVEAMPTAAADVNPISIPVASELASLTPPYVSFANAEYRPEYAPPEGTPVVDLAAYNFTNPSKCAQACSKTFQCNAATWTGAHNNEWLSNCWLKKIAEPCRLPKYAEAVTNFFFLVQMVPGCVPLEQLCFVRCFQFTTSGTRVKEAFEVTFDCASPTTAQATGLLG
jgi:hypothetical protein